MTSSRLNITDQTYYQRQVLNDADVTISPRTSIVAITALTQTRTLTLPNANSYYIDLPLTIIDESGSLTSSIAINLAVGGTNDKINGLSNLTIKIPYFCYTLGSNNSTKWTIRALGLAVLNNDPNFYQNVSSGSGNAILLSTML